MNIHLNCLFNYGLSFFKENILSSLTAQKKKIIMVASAIFGCSVAYYVLKRCFKVNEIIDEDGKLEQLRNKIFNQKLFGKNDEEKNPKIFQKIPLNDGLVWEGEGIIDNGDLKEGKGKLAFRDGHEEEGSFKNGKLNGKGKMTFSNGSIWEGEFKDGLLTGQGTKRFSDKTVFEGEFKENDLNGKGKKSYSFGLVEEGQFKHEVLNGQGRISHPRSIISKGEITSSDEEGLSLTEKGEFKDGKLNGQGKIFCYQDGKPYEYWIGEFQDANFIKGEMYSRDRVTFHGQFKMGLLYEGKKQLFNGTVEEGKFNENELNGEGKRTYPDGTIEKGNFKNGKFIQP